MIFPKSRRGWQSWAGESIDAARARDIVASDMTEHSPNVVPLEGEIDLHVSPQIGARLAAMIKQKPAKLVVDLSQVTYIDSSGLAVLIEAMQNVGSYGGKFALTGLQDGVRPIFEIARLDQVFRIFPDPAAALAA
jgi:anti-sigma B factor antagonist